VTARPDWRIERGERLNGLGYGPAKTPTGATSDLSGTSPASAAMVAATFRRLMRGPPLERVRVDTDFEIDEVQLLLERGGT
jgi:hypothetical protein